MENEGFEFIDGDDFQAVADTLEDLVGSGS